MPRVNLEVNLDDVKVGFPLLPVGEYDVLVIDLPVEKRNAEKGTRSLRFKFTIQDDPEFSGKKILHSCSLNPDYVGLPAGLKDTLAHLGVDWDSEGFALEDCQGCRTRVEVGQRFRKDNEGNLTEQADNFIVRFLD